MPSHAVEDRVKAMIAAADLFSVAASKPFLHEYPEFARDFGATSEVLSTFDLLMAVASAGVAYHAIPLMFSMPIANEYRMAIPAQLSRWRDGAGDLLSAYLGVTDTVAPRFQEGYTRAAGIFVVWGIARAIGLDRPARQSLEEFAPALGRLVVRGFAEWWQDSSSRDDG